MRGLVFDGVRSLALVEEPDRALHPKEIRVQTVYSGISAGVELASYRGTSPFFTKRFDYQTQLFLADAPGAAYPLGPVGYQESGIAVEVGRAVRGIRPGDRVCGIWGHRSSWVLTEETASAGLMPGAIDFVVGCFNYSARIAVNALLDADLHVGDRVAVFGAGTVGQLVSQLARLAGARVILVDPCRLRLDIAGELGTPVLIDPTGIDVGREIKRLTENHGVDLAFECSGNAAALHEAIRSCAYGATVVTLGFYQGPASALALGEEFHHNRVTLVSSQIGGSNPSLRHRWSLLRITQEVRRLLFTERLLRVEPLVTHRFPLEQANAAFHLLDSEPHTALQVVLTFE